MDEQRQDYSDQKRHFESEKNRYPRNAILDPPLHTTIEIQRVLDGLAGVPTSSPVIDFGAGTGRISIPLARAGFSTVHAIDISPSSLATLDDLAQELALPAIQTSTEMPTKGTFGAIVGADILHHVDLDEYLPRFHAILADGGKLVFTEPGGMNPIWYVYLSIAYDMRVERGIVHCNLYTLRSKLRRHGFRDVKIAGVGILPRPLFNFGETAVRLHDRAGNLPFLRWFAYRYLIVASK